jgi:hypothetical protein
LRVVHARQDKAGVAAVNATTARLLLGISMIWGLVSIMLLALPRGSTPDPGMLCSGFGMLLFMGFAVWSRWSPACRAYRRVLENPDQLCHGCGYQLTPEQDRCPECGWNVARRGVAREAEDPAEPRHGDKVIR